MWKSRHLDMLKELHLFLCLYTYMQTEAVRCGEQSIGLGSTVHRVLLFFSYIHRGPNFVANVYWVTLKKVSFTVPQIHSGAYGSPRQLVIAFT